jgi:hypothetical protein
VHHLAQSAHATRDSLLHSGTGFEDFRGLYNLALLALVSGFAPDFFDYPAMSRSPRSLLTERADCVQPPHGSGEHHQVSALVLAPHSLRTSSTRSRFFIY